MQLTQLTDYQSNDLILSHLSVEDGDDGSLHSHDICELSFLKKGDLSYIAEGKNYRIGKNCLFISRPSQIHCIKLPGKRDYERYTVLFDERKLHSDIYNRIPRDITYINFDGNTLISDLFKKMDYYCQNFEGDILEKLLLHLTEEILCHVLLASSESSQDNVYTVNPTINTVLQYIENNLTTPLTVRSICERFYITKSHLHQLFLKHLGTSPKKYIVSKKMLMAQRELRTGAKPTDVYLNCGFTDYTTFFRDYKKYFGHAPSEEIHVQIVRKIHL